MSFPSGFSYSENFIQVKASPATKPGETQQLVISDFTYKADGTTKAYVGAILRYPCSALGKIVSLSTEPFNSEICVEPHKRDTLPGTMDGAMLIVMADTARKYFDWKKLDDGYTMFAGGYHADTHFDFRGEWRWYVFKGTEKIGSEKGLEDSSVSRAAAEKCILEHQKSANGGK